MDFMLVESNSKAERRNEMMVSLPPVNLVTI